MPTIEVVASDDEQDVESFERSSDKDGDDKDDSPFDKRTRTLSSGSANTSFHTLDKD